MPVCVRHGPRWPSGLRAELGDDLYNSWFGRMEPEGFVDGALAASVPTRFLKSWIENHYAAKLTKIAVG